MEHEESPRYAMLMFGIDFMLFLIAAKICNLEMSGY